MRFSSLNVIDAVRIWNSTFPATPHRAVLAVLCRIDPGTRNWLYVLYCNVCTVLYSRKNIMIILLRTERNVLAAFAWRTMLTPPSECFEGYHSILLSGTRIAHCLMPLLSFICYAKVLLEYLRMLHCAVPYLIFHKIFLFQIIIALYYYTKNLHIIFFYILTQYGRIIDYWARLENQSQQTDFTSHITSHYVTSNQIKSNQIISHHHITSHHTV